MAERGKKSWRKSRPRSRRRSGPRQGSPQCQSRRSELRDEIGEILSSKAGQLQDLLAALGQHGGNGRRKSSLKGHKVTPKYRNPKNRSETWAGRGAMPRWMAAEIKAGKKRESFLIHKGK